MVGYPARGHHLPQLFPVEIELHHHLLLVVLLQAAVRQQGVVGVEGPGLCQEGRDDGGMDDGVLAGSELPKQKSSHQPSCSGDADSSAAAGMDRD
ncbi:hypothetical protein FHR56_000114 [Xanthomonas sacchari]|uniref:hypothetical protein n=1 Tax=unclassified Xanthomonas TaxID=2643310 RepID=UPI00136945D2|nr:MULTISPECIES: hypothetical protein [unclassified Xanthomonas]MBB6365001.1 hypothetical protein [Xanthomonas sp. F10]